MKLACIRQSTVTIKDVYTIYLPKTVESGESCSWFVFFYYVNLIKRGCRGSRLMLKIQILSIADRYYVHLWQVLMVPPITKFYCSIILCFGVILPVLIDFLTASIHHHVRFQICFSCLHGLGGFL